MNNACIAFAVSNPGRLRTYIKNQPRRGPRHFQNYGYFVSLDQVASGHIPQSAYGIFRKVEFIKYFGRSNVCVYKNILLWK